MLSAEDEAVMLATHNSESLVHHYMPLVKSIAARYKGNGVPHEDLVQEGVIGLLTAIEKYDPSHGARLGTYARYHIEGTIRRYTTRNRTYTVDTPAYETAVEVDYDEGIAVPAVMSVVNELPARSKDVLMSRVNGVGLKELGKKYKISCERVRQIEAHSIVIVRNKLGVA